MAYNDSDDSVTLEVQSRLDDIFGDLDEPEESPEESPVASPAESPAMSPAPGPGDPVDDPLMDLKSLLLSVEWEITDDIMAQLVKRIDALKDKYKEDRILLLFLQLLRSLSNYIKSHKGGSHPKAFQILNSVFRSLEKVTATIDMTEPEKKRNLLVELAKFKKLKEQIALAKTGGKEPPKPAPPVKKVKKADAPAPVKPTVQARPEPVERVEAPEEAFAEAPSPPAPRRDPVLESLEEIKRMIRSEFKALRKELALLKRGG